MSDKPKNEKKSESKTEKKSEKKTENKSENKTENKLEKTSENKTVKRLKKQSSSSNAVKAVRRALMFLLSLIAVCMIVLVVYMLRNGSTDPRVSEGITNNWAPVVSTAEPEMTEALEATEETEPVDPILYAAQQTLDSMTLEEKVYQMFFVTNHELTGQYYANTADDMSRIALESKPVGGIVYDSDNIFSRAQLETMIAGLQTYSDIPLLIGVEEEGGTNSYLSSIGVTAYYDQMGVYGDENATERVYEIGNEIGSAITEIGFNIDLAPVADSLSNPYNTEIGRRAFSSDPHTTAMMVMQMVRGLHSANCMTCLKYFPALSASNTDSRYGMAVSNITSEELQENLLPFSIGIDNGADMIMVSHLGLPNIIGDNRPADLCPEIVDNLLRGQLNYQGVVMTDSFQKGAITYNYEIDSAAVQAVQAGCDIIYRPGDLNAAAQAILDAVDSGVLTEERINQSVLRILILKYSNGLD